MTDRPMRVDQADRTKARGSEKGRSRRAAASPTPLEQLEPRTMMSGGGPIMGVSPLVTPSGLVAQAVAPHAVSLSWSDVDPSAIGFLVLRSDNGSSYSAIARVTSASTHTFTDATAASNRTYWYEVESYNAASVSGASDAASAKTPMAAPSGLAVSALGPSSIQLKWKDNDTTALSYKILRSSDGVSYSVLTVVNGATAAAFVDSGLASGKVYWYEVQAVSGSVTSAASSAARCSTTLSAPTDLHASTTPTTVTLSWSGLDPSATGFVVMRSLDGTTFAARATLSAGSSSYTDSGLTTATNYYYKVQATSATSGAGVSGAVRALTGLLAPTNVVAQVSGVKVSITWADTNRAGVGYYVLRSTDGVNFIQVAALGAGSAKSYLDGGVSPNQSYTYEVEAVVGGMVSSVSMPAHLTTPDGTGTVTITSRFGNELVVTAFGKADSIIVREVGTLLTIIADGQTFTQIALAAGLFIYDRGGADVITIDPSVTVRTTITALGAGITTVSSGSSSVSAWLDAGDSFSGAGVVHWVGALAGGVSKAVGASLAKPLDAGTTVRLNDSLWGTGPVAGDVNQGGVGDCYFLSSLAAFAGVKPSVLRESAVDLGDGTFLVQFMKGSTATFVRVSNEMSTGNYWGYHFARPGANNAMWALVMEKAFAYFRTGANTYASISGGWMGEVYSDLGVRNSSFTLATTESSFYSMMSSDLVNGLAVTFGTTSSAPNLVRGHAYTLVGASIDGSGVTHYVIRNPWGISGDAMENSAGYATLTFAQMQANFGWGAQAVA